MATIGTSLHLPAEKVLPYRRTADSLRDLDLLGRLHMDPASGQFLDYGLHSADAVLARKSYPMDGQAQVEIGVGVGGG
jgi:hypothetical protein